MIEKILAPFKMLFAIVIFIAAAAVMSCTNGEDECHVTKVCTNISDGG